MVSIYILLSQYFNGKGDTIEQLWSRHEQLFKIKPKQRLEDLSRSSGKRETCIVSIISLAIVVHFQ